MLQLIYVSNAISNIDNEQLTKILSIAQQNNSRNGITGFLVLHRDQFFQILEGPEEQVLSTFERIEASHLHDRVEIILQRECDDRHFGVWSMGHLDLLAVDPELNDKLMDMLKRGGDSIHVREIDDFLDAVYHHMMTLKRIAG